MKVYKDTNGLKDLVLASSFVILTSFSACSDGSQEEQKNQAQTEQTTQTSPKIEIVENKNAKEIKVAQKEDGNTSGSSYYYDYGEKSAYDQNAQPANGDASVRVRPRTEVDANMNVRSPYEQLEVSMLVNKLSKEFIVRCSACHNDYANGIIGPSLLEKDSTYIYKQIIAFKTGKRKNVLMSDLVKQMSDKELKKMADEIYNFNLEIAKMRNR
ncbi:c-type cytochrome [Sulfurimonas sp.]